MKLIRSIAEEIFGLFVDDGALAVLSLVLVAVIAAAVKLLGLSGQLGGILLGLGCLAILAYSVGRGASRR